MFKTTLIFIMTLMMCLSAGAGSFVRTHEEFVHLSEYQKNQYIIKVMELVVELESKYEFETKKYGYSQKRFERFQKAVQKITSLLFIDSAYARSIHPAGVNRNNWEAMARSFETILASGSGNRCIFAGWVSETYQSGGKTYCAHPATRQNAARGYPDPAPGESCGRSNTNRIQCNPVIFGYKNSQSKSLFCVSTESNAENSSLQCMKKALGITAEANADSAEDRLATLRNNLSNNASVFGQVQEFVYRTCVCETSHERFNQDYQNAIRPHRTCLGLMNMIGETVQCEDPRLPLQDRSLFENLQSKIVDQSVGGNAADTIYRQFLSDLDRSSPEYRRICQLPQEEKVYRCVSANCTLQGPTEGSGVSGSTLSCTYVVTEEGSETQVTFSEAPSQVPVEGENSVEISFKVNGQPGNATCTNISRPQPEENGTEYTCQASCKIAASQAASSRPTGNEAPSAPQGGEGTEGAATPAEAPGCTVTSLKDSNNTDIPIEVVTAPELPTEAGSSSLNFVLKINNEEKSVACQTTTEVIGGAETNETNPEEDQDGEELKLEVKITSTTDTNVQIEATFEDQEGQVFKWNTEDVPSAKTVTETWKARPEEATSIAVAQDESTEQTPETPVVTSDGKKITQSRYDFDYKVCGKLTKGEEERKACVTVPKKGGAADASRKAPLVNPNLQPGGQMQIRGTSDASAIGIR